MGIKEPKPRTNWHTRCCGKQGGKWIFDGFSGQAVAHHAVSCRHSKLGKRTQTVHPNGQKKHRPS